MIVDRASPSQGRPDQVRVRTSGSSLRGVEGLVTEGDSLVSGG